MKKPYVVAIAGGTCSGKSTLSERLEALFADRCRTVIFHMDTYFKTVDPPTVVAPITRKVYPERNSPEAIDLEKFYPDFEKAIAPDSDADLVIVEGLFALYLDPIRERADLKVFVDLESDERIVRRIIKHMAWGNSFEDVTERYLDTVRFRHKELIEPTRWHADMVLNGTLNRHKGVEILTRYIEIAVGLQP